MRVKIPVLGIFTALLLVAATRGYSQLAPFENERRTFSSSVAGQAILTESERSKFSSSFAGQAVLSAESERSESTSSIVKKTISTTAFDRYFLPSDSQSGSSLNALIGSLGIKGSFDFTTQNPGSLKGIAAEHLDLLDEQRVAVKQRAAAGSGAEEQTILAKVSDAVFGLFQPRTIDFIRPEIEQYNAVFRDGEEEWSELDIFAVVVLGVIGVLSFVASLAKRRAAA